MFRWGKLHELHDAVEGAEGGIWEGSGRDDLWTDAAAEILASSTLHVFLASIAT